MSWIAVGVGVASAGASYLNGQKAAGAAGAAAEEQMDLSKKWLQTQKENYNKADSFLANAVTPEQMATHSAAISQQEKVVQRQEQLAQNINPALIQAGSNLNEVLKGGSSPQSAAFQSQRQNARTQLIDQLKGQYGAGAETSSAGQQALQRFDQDTQSQLANLNNSYIQQLSGISLNGMSQTTQSGNSVAANLQNIGAADPMAENAKDRATLAMNFSQQAGEANKAVINAAGAGQVAAGIQSQANQSIISGFGQAAGGIAGYLNSNSSSNLTPGASTNTISDMGGPAPGQKGYNPNSLGYNVRMVS